MVNACHSSLATSKYCYGIKCKAFRDTKLLASGYSMTKLGQNAKAFQINHCTDQPRNVLNIIVWSRKKLLIFDKQQQHRKHTLFHDDVIKWKHSPRNWPFVQGIHRSPVTSQHKGHWRGVLMFSLICTWINGWVKNKGAGDQRRHRPHYDVSVMCAASTAPASTQQQQQR